MRSEWFGGGVMAICLLLPGVARAEGKPAPRAAPGVKDVRSAVERSLPYLEKEGLAWWKQRKCNGCHHGAFLLWSHHEARARGFAVDEKKLAGWTDQAFEFFLKDIKEHKTKKNGYVEGGNLVLALGTGLGETADKFKTIGEILVDGQKDEGFWKYEGQGLKRPDPENNEATTLWAIFALTTVENKDAGFVKSRTRALEWLKKAPTGASNEALVLHILAEDQFGDKGRAKTLLDELKKQQNADGGWSWTKERKSEAFATGQSLYALGRMGVSADDPAVRRAWAFLLETQKEDGSWASPTRKPPGLDNPIAVYWGTAWATIGLTRTLAAK